MEIGTFRHDALDLERPSFRLLRLLRADGIDSLKCDIFQAHHDEPDAAIVSYEALSYTWGPTDQERQSISMTDGTKLEIGVNLFEALRNLRLPDRDRILWVDAICIDQENPKERGHQVRQMGDIYRRADRVLFWLGAATYETDIAMESLNRMQNVALRHPCWKWTRGDRRWATLWEEALNATKAKFPCLQQSTLQEGIKSLLERPWFTRVWILQEAANARSGLVCCGSKAVSSRVFTLSPRLVAVQPSPQCQAVLDIMPGPWRDTYQRQGRTLYNLLCAFADSQATDPRDMIYALLGISGDANTHEGLQPDYDKSEEDLVRDTVHFLYFCDIPDQHTPDTVQGLLRRLWSLNHIALNTLAERGERQIMARLFQRDGVTVTKDILKSTSTLSPSAFTLIFCLLVQCGIERGDYSYTICFPHSLPYSKPTASSRLERWGDPDTLYDSSDFYVAVDRECGPDDGKKEIWLTPTRGRNASHLPPLLQWLATAQPETARSGRTLLSLASEQGNSIIVNDLLSLNPGVYMHRPDRLGQTPLIWAAREGRNDVVKQLLGAGAIIDHQDRSGRTALAWAAFKGHVGVVESLLLDKCSTQDTLNLKDSSGKSALCLASMQGHQHVVRLLVRGKIELEARCSQGRTALFWAVLNKHEDAVALLLLKGADPNATESRHPNALISPSKVSMNALHPPRQWKTMLELAVEANNRDILVHLVDGGADIDALDGKGRTPLGTACELGREGLVTTLLEKGADSRKRDGSGKSPLEWAREMKQQSIICMLIEQESHLKG